jgi:TRAP-type C4-dicarboxylate transport system substrate-binding protein
VSQIAWGRLSTADRALLREATKEAETLQRSPSAETDKKLLTEFRAMSRAFCRIVHA